MNRLKIIGIFTILLLTSLLAKAQNNIFTTANIASTTILPTPDYGTASNLYDGNEGTYLYWGDPTITSQTFTIKLNTAQKIGYYEFTFVATDYLPTSILLSGSNNGSSWTTLNTTTVSNSSPTVKSSFNNNSVLNK